MNYPLIVKSTINAPYGINNDWSAATANFPPAQVSIPREFGGPNTAQSPEDYFAIALISCFTGTFKVVAERIKFEFEELNGNCEITIDRSSEHIVRVTNARLNFELVGSTDKAKALRLLEQTSKQCILINSLVAKAKFEFKIGESSVG